MQNDEFLRILREQSPRRADPCSGGCALMVVDMQEHFRSMAGAILPRLSGLVQFCQQNEVPVIYTQHGHKNTQSDGGMLAEWWGDIIVSDSFDAQLMPEIAPQPGEKIVAKNRYSAFYKTDLEEYLKTKEIRNLIIGGVMTNLCCETTARDAFMRDYRVFFLADGTATATEELHQATLRNLAFGFAYLVTCEEIIGQLNGSV
ncbi:isochorismatase family protein [Candidatus Zixiibacteriota bacterium]